MFQQRISILRYFQALKRKKSIVLLLALTIILGIYIRLRPLHGKYPIGWDAGNYQTFAMAFAKSWPFVPETIPIVGGIPTTSQILPLLPSLMATFHVISNLDLFTVTQLTPIIIFIPTCFATYFLSKEATDNAYIGLLAAFFYSTASLELTYTYPGYLTRTLFANFLIIGILLFVIRSLNHSMFSKKGFWRNCLIAAVFLSALIASHDFSLIALIVIVLSSFCVVLIVYKTMSFNFFASITISVLLGFLFSSPVLYFWRGFYMERLFYSVSTSEAGKVEAHTIRVMSTFSLSSYGIVMCLFGIVGILTALLKWRKRLEIHVLAVWFFSMLIMANIYHIGVFFYPYRFLSYFVVPFSIFAAIGLYYVIIQKKTRVLNRFRLKSVYTDIFLLSMIVVVCSLQIFEGTMAMDNAAGTHVVLTPQFEDAMLWLRNNSAENSIVFTSVFCPWALSNYVPAVSERTRLRTPPNVPAGWELEYERNLDAYNIITLDNPELARNSLTKYLTAFDEAYVFLSNQEKHIDWAKLWGEDIDLTKLRKYYDPVFNNTEIIIFRVMQNFQEETNAVVVYDDEETFWSVTGGGTGDLMVATSEEFVEKVKGYSSMIVSVTTGGTYKWVGIKRDYALPQDWSNKDVFCFYFYGKNTTETVNIYIETSINDRYVWRISDEFIGWKWIILPFNNPSASLGNGLYLDRVNTVRLAFYNQSTWYVDRVIVDNW